MNYPFCSRIPSRSFRVKKCIKNYPNKYIKNNFTVLFNRSFPELGDSLFDPPDGIVDFLVRGKAAQSKT